MRDHEASIASVTTTRDSSPGGVAFFTRRLCRVQSSDPAPTLASSMAKNDRLITDKSKFDPSARDQYGGRSVTVALQTVNLSAWVQIPSFSPMRVSSNGKT